MCTSQSKACQAKTAVYKSGEKFRGNELTQNSCRKHIKHYMACKTHTKAMKETNEVLGYVFYNPCYLSLKLYLLQIRPVKCNCSHFPAQNTKFLFWTGKNFLFCFQRKTHSSFLQVRLSRVQLLTHPVVLSSCYIYLFFICLSQLFCYLYEHL